MQSVTQMIPANILQHLITQYSQIWRVYCTARQDSDETLIRWDESAFVILYTCIAWAKSMHTGTAGAAGNSHACVCTLSEALYRY